MFGCTKRIERKLDRLTSMVEELAGAVRSLTQGVMQMSTEIDDLVAEVAQVENVESSALTLIQGLIAQLEVARQDPAKLSAVIKRLYESRQKLAAAVAANTAPPAPPVETAPPASPPADTTPPAATPTPTP